MCSKKMWRYMSLLTLVVFGIFVFIQNGAAQNSAGQDGTAGIDKANTLVRTYFERGIYLLYAIGAVMGLVGAIKVYSKWSQGDPDTSKTAASWFGSCIFLVVVTTVLKSFFGV